ncbi:MAG: hypothetical protein KGJ78_14030 [Alphaproteobacteria bacterium]|nr:hypothetical protein [Alphaproteobacteria bacterium]
MAESTYFQGVGRAVQPNTKTTGTAKAARRFLVPAVCDVSVTNVCNATCDFCAFAHDKGIVKDRRWLDRERFIEALPILQRRGVRYVNFQGGVRIGENWRIGAGVEFGPPRSTGQDESATARSRLLRARASSRWRKVAVA